MTTAPLNLSSASARVSALRSRAIQLAQWSAGLFALGTALGLIGSWNLAIAAGAGAVTALSIIGISVGERRRLLLALVAQGDATSIPAVATLARRLATDTGARRRLASGLRAAASIGRDGHPSLMVVDPVRAYRYASRLLALADALADERRTVAAESIALCQRLLTDAVNSPLYNDRLPERDLDQVLAAVERGISPEAALTGK